MKTYQSPNLEVIALTVDVICTSLTAGDKDPGRNDIFYTKLGQ